MSGRDLILGWGGKEYRLPATKFFAVAEEVEDFFTVADLATMRTSLKLRKLSRAYGTMLRAAGANFVTDQAVFTELSKQMQRQEEAVAITAMMALSELLLEGAPDDLLNTSNDEGEAKQPEDFI